MNIELFMARNSGSSEHLLRFSFSLIKHCCKRTLRHFAFQALTALGKVSITTFLMFLCVCFSTLSIAEVNKVNRLLASQCAQCHGPDGKAFGDMEKLTDESAKDLFEDLRDMRREDEPENIMDHQALGYSEDQILRIAAYFGSLKNAGDRDDED